MASEAGIVTLGSVGIAIDAWYAIDHGYDPFLTLLPGAIFLTACVLIGQWDASLGLGLVGVFVLASLLFRGQSLINGLADLAGSGKATRKNG